MAKLKATSSPDYLFVGLVLFFTIFGLVMLASASSDLAEKRFDNSFYYLNHQISRGLIVGVIGFLFGAFFYYRRWERLAVPLLFLTIVLLVLVFTPLGFTIKGASRWVSILGVTVQPAEILKLTFFIYLAAWLAKNQKRSSSFKAGFLPFMFLIGLVILLIVFQPSTTTAVIIFLTAVATYFTAGGKFKFLIAAVLLVGLALSVFVYITPYRYRIERIMTFLNKNVDVLKEGYHINQSLIAIGSGGLFGVGYGQSTTKLSYLPEAIGDSIFVVIAEELGFVGATILIFAFLVLVLRGISIGKRAPDVFGRLLVTGFVTLIGIQAFVNIASQSGLIPLTGVPLPFISFGGTALAVFLTMSGIIVNVSRYR